MKKTLKLKDEIITEELNPYSPGPGQREKIKF